MHNSIPSFSALLPASQREQLHEISEENAKKGVSFANFDLLQNAHELELDAVRSSVFIKKAFKQVLVRNSRSRENVAVYYTSAWGGSDVSILLGLKFAFLIHSVEKGMWIVRSDSHEIGRIYGSHRRPIGMIEGSEKFHLKFPFLAGLWGKASIELKPNGRRIAYRRYTLGRGLFTDEYWSEGLDSQTTALLILCLIWRGSYYLSV